MSGEIVSRSGGFLFPDKQTAERFRDAAERLARQGMMGRSVFDVEWQYVAQDGTQANLEPPVWPCGGT